MAEVTDAQIKAAWQVHKAAGHSIKYEVEFLSLTCAGCGILFALPATFIGERKADHQTFHCPAGHPNNFPHKTPADLLVEKHAATINNLQQQMTSLQQAQIQTVEKIKHDHAIEIAHCEERIDYWLNKVRRLSDRLKKLKGEQGK